MATCTSISHQRVVSSYRCMFEELLCRSSQLSKAATSFRLRMSVMRCRSTEEIAVCECVLYNRASLCAARLSLLHFERARARSLATLSTGFGPSLMISTCFITSATRWSSDSMLRVPAARLEPCSRTHWSLRHWYSSLQRLSHVVPCKQVRTPSSRARSSRSFLPGRSPQQRVPPNRVHSQRACER